MPKSATSVDPSVVRSRFSGLMSRWITPCRCACGLGGNPYGRAHRQLPLPPEPIAERLALDERHGKPELAGGLARVVDREDVRMLEPGGEPDLALEAFRAKCAGEIGVQYLE